MIQSIELLRSLEYPGRLIGLGLAPDSEHNIIFYAITGRSASSQARKLVSRDDGIWVQPTDEDVLKTGNPDLLVYPAVLFHDLGLAVSNGKQTEDIRARLESRAHPASVLAEAHRAWEYEPDSPIFTPRISGCLREGKSALGIIRRGHSGESLKNYFEIPPVPGRIRVISTYQGPNEDPVPSFCGEPREAPLEAGACREAAESIYESLIQPDSDKDFRVAVACVFVSAGDPKDEEVHIINRHERT